jgi:integrase
VRLTKQTIRTLACPPGVKERTYFDDDLPGFGLRVRAGSGTRSWLYQYADRNHATKKIFLGSPDVVDAGQARQAARELVARIRLGDDPAAEKAAERAQAAESFAALLPRFMERQRARLKPRSLLEVERHLLRQAKPLHGRPVAQITRRDIAKLLTEAAETSGGPASNRLRASLSGYFLWLAHAGFVDSNVVSVTDRAIEGGPRERVVADAELRAIWLALGADDYSDILRLLVLTGARRDEIGALAWDEIDFAAATITLRPARTKNRREHIIPLSAPAAAILAARRDGAGERPNVFGRGQGGFSGWSKAKAELDARLGEAAIGWRLHDFRRSLSTWLHEAGTPPHVVETILGHVSGHKAGVAATYNKALYLPERARALTRWAAHIAALVGEPAAATIVKLR